MKIESIIVDMDGVLVDFYLGLDLEMTKRNFKISEDNRDSWSLTLHYKGDTLFIENQIEDIVSKISFWENLPILDTDALSVFKKLCEKYKIIVATVPWKSAIVNCEMGKTFWMEKYFPKSDYQLIFNKEDDKWKMKADAMIEDSGKTLSKFQGTSIMMNARHNLDCSGYIRVYDWNDIENMLL